MQYDFHPEAQRELQIAADYYDGISPELGDAFLDEVERSLERIVHKHETLPNCWLSLRYRLPDSGRSRLDCCLYASPAQAKLLDR
jgi:hypothetical protein